MRFLHTVISSTVPVEIHAISELYWQHRIVVLRPWAVYLCVPHELQDWDGRPPPRMGLSSRHKYAAESIQILCRAFVHLFTRLCTSYMRHLNWGKHVRACMPSAKEKGCASRQWFSAGKQLRIHIISYPFDTASIWDLIRQGITSAPRLWLLHQLQDQLCCHKICMSALTSTALLNVDLEWIAGGPHACAYRSLFVQSAAEARQLPSCLILLSGSAAPQCLVKGRISFVTLLFLPAASFEDRHRDANFTRDRYTAKPIADLGASAFCFA